jgi:3D (Asp-Asp-Asp) domain-containing protein
MGPFTVFACTAQLAGARTARSALLTRLARQRRLNAAQIATLEAAARAAELKAAAINREAAPAPVAVASAPVTSAGGRTLTVSATGYSLTGRTATGVPVGWGVVAVDPAVIPLGTHMTIPGYGEGVAADTGGAVRGASIDLWFPSDAQARAWGRRVVTITLH